MTTTTLTTYGRTLIDDADASAARTTLGLGTLATKSTVVSADITDGTIVSADIASGTIVTADLASSVLSSYAPLTSPGLLGSPTTPTATSGTNTDQIASTAYVQTEIGSLGTNANGARTVDTVGPSGGSDGDIWYRY
jgi:hypothetical protein